MWLDLFSEHEKQEGERANRSNSAGKEGLDKHNLVYTPFRLISHKKEGTQKRRSGRLRGGVGRKFLNHMFIR